MDDPETGVEIVEHGVEYDLGEGLDYYGVWRKGARDESLVRFPRTDEGFEAAVAYFERVNRARLLVSGALSIPLLVLIVSGLFVWIVGGAIVTVKGSGVSFYGQGTASTFIQNVAIAESVAFRVWVGALMSLIALGVVRYLGRRDTSGS